MKSAKKTTLLFFLLFATLSKVNAQKKINEGIATYTATYELTAQQLLYADQLPKEITCYFRGDSTAAIVNQGNFTIKGVSVLKTNYYSMLIEIPASSKKIAVVLTPAEIEEEKAADPHFTGTKGTEMQIINGYNCTKVSIADAKNSATYDIWVTNDIDIVPNSVSKLVSEFGGVPVKFITFNRGIKISAELIEIKETPIPAGFFTATKDYQSMSFDQLKALPAN
jgi:hypothetical protein